VERTLAAHAVDRKLHKVICEEVPKTGLLVRTPDFQDRMRTILLGYLAFHREMVRPKNHELAVRVLMTAVESVVTELACDESAGMDDPEIVEELAALIVGYVRGA
jgi:hypothetical protein